MTPCRCSLSISVMLTTALNKSSSSKRFPFLFTASSALLLLASAQFGCGRPFSVKTQPNLPSASYPAKATVDSVAVEAQAITDEDFLYDTFDANLISAGVLPVRVMVTNSGGEAVDLKSARFEIEARAGRFKAVEARKAFKRLISYYEIKAYSKSGYTESLEAFAAFCARRRNPAWRRSVSPGTRVFSGVERSSAPERFDDDYRQAEFKTVGRGRLAQVELTSPR